MVAGLGEDGKYLVIPDKRWTADEMLELLKGMGIGAPAAEQAATDDIQQEDEAEAGPAVDDTPPTSEDKLLKLIEVELGELELLEV